MRQVTAAFAVAGICILGAGCGGASNQASVKSTTTITSLIPRPVVARELDELLLSPEQIDPLIGAKDMAVMDSRGAATTRGISGGWSLSAAFFRLMLSVASISTRT